MTRIGLTEGRSRSSFRPSSCQRPLPHARQSETSVIGHGPRVETNAVVDDAEVNPSVVREMDDDRPRLSMPGCVRDRLANDAKKCLASRGIEVQAFRNFQLDARS
jgi:hypothetical protein